MENQAKTQTGVTLTRQEAEAYCAYKRQKKMGEIMAAMRCSESLLTANDSAVKTCERATRLRQSAVRMTPSEMAARGSLFHRAGVKIDCIIGGTGETFAKVKAYEAKQAIRAGAGELTLIVTPSLVAGSRYTELRKELRRLRKTAGKIPLKVRVEKLYPKATLSRLARLSSEAGAKYFSTPYFDGCQQLLTDLFGGCRLEVSDVDTLADFKKTAGAGMGRVLTNRIWEIYTEWLSEAEQITLETTSQTPPRAIEVGAKTPLLAEKKTEEKGTEKAEKTVDKEEKKPSVALQKVNSETEYACRLDGTKLKFS